MISAPGSSQILIYRASVKSGHVAPVAVFKKGEQYKSENSQLISLTVIPCKLLEHVVVSTIMEYVEE